MNGSPPENTSTERHIVQNFLLVWLDANIDESNEYCKNSITQLRRIVNTTDTFTDAERCIDFLTEIKDEKAFMIVSCVLGQNIMPLIHDVSQLHAIYVFCENKSHHEQWAKEWSKVRGVFTDIKLICQSLQKVARQCDQDSIPMSFVSLSSDSPKQSMDQLDQSFMYTQLFKEILLEIDHDKVQSVKELATYCRNQNIDNSEITKFEQEYRRQTPIWWYTYECFLYSMLNRALRTLEVDTILKMCFFICDLHRHIQKLHSEQSSGANVPFTVYRGQGLSKPDFEKLVQTEGGLISFNNFLSTSIDRELSFAFAESNGENPDLMGILFQIEIDRWISSVPFALLDNVSCFSSEREILFSMHTVFRIGEIKQIDRNNSRLWKVTLTLTSDNDPQLSALTAQMRKETFEGSNGWYRLAELLRKIGELDKAEQLYTVLLDKKSDESSKAALYNQLGCIKHAQDEYKEAILLYEKALQIDKKTLHPNHPDLGKSYNNIGNVYYHRNEYSKALSFYEKSIEIKQKTLPPNDPSLAMSYYNIGTVYENMSEYSKALLSHEKALDIRLKSLPPYHSDLAASHNNIGNVYFRMGEYSKAFSFCGKAMEISQKTLPPNHPDLAVSYNNIGNIYFVMGEHSKALSFYEKASEIKEKTLSPNNPSLASYYTNVGNVYFEMGEYSKSLSSQEKALEIKEKSLPPNHHDLAVSYNNIGNVHLKMGEYPKALLFYGKELEILQKTIPPNQPDLATTHHNIGSVYKNMCEYSKALLSHEKALEIREKILPPNDPDLAKTYDSIGWVYYNVGEYSKAFSFYGKALKIHQKTFPPNQLSLASSYTNVGNVYFQMGEYSKSLSSQEKGLAIKQKSLPPNHHGLAVSYNNIGNVHLKMGEYPKALLFYGKGLEILQKILPPNDPDLAKTYGSIGWVYYNVGEYSKAFSFYEKNLEILQKTLPPNHPDLAAAYQNSVACGMMGGYSKAL